MVEKVGTVGTVALSGAGGTVTLLGLALPGLSHCWDCCTVGAVRTVALSKLSDQARSAVVLYTTQI